MSTDTRHYDDGWTHLGTARFAVRGDAEGVRRMAIAGEIDVGCAAEIKRHVGESATGDVVIDLSGLEFVDSTGIRLLVDLRREADEAGRRMRYVDPHPKVLRLLELTGLREGLLSDG